LETPITFWFLQTPITSFSSAVPNPDTNPKIQASRDWPPALLFLAAVLPILPGLGLQSSLPCSPVLNARHGEVHLHITCCLSETHLQPLPFYAAPQLALANLLQGD
jgi:hypothetical protein